MTSETATPAEIENLTYEQARDELVRVVSQLESGGVNLEQSLALWERGEALADHCQQWLDGARQRVAAAVQPSSDQQAPDQPAAEDDGSD